MSALTLNTVDRIPPATETGAESIQDSVRSLDLGHRLHDLANALNIVLGYLEIAVEDPSLSAPLREVLQEAYTGAQQATADVMSLRAVIRRDGAT